MPGNNYTQLTASATTVIGPASATVNPRRINILGFSINKILVGTLTVKTGSTQIAQFAATTPVGMQWYPEGGTEIADPQFTLSGADDVTVFWNNL